MIYLSQEEILLIHSIAIDETGGSHGLRDRVALAALEGLPKQKAFGEKLYPSTFHKAAVYARNIIGAHPFVDGNKRTAMTTAGVFFELNGYRIVAEEGEIRAMALRIIEKKLSIEVIAAWLKEHTKKISRS